MKKYKNITKTLCLALSLAVFASCSDILDITPKDTLNDPTVWGSNDAIVAYLAKLYDQMQTEDLDYAYEDGTQYPTQITDESVRSYTWGFFNEPVIRDGVLKWWGYEQVRNANSFLEKVETASISDELKTLYKAEVRFIRAFHYFSMVKRYGGVPLITEVQEYTGSNLNELQVPRNTEKEVYEFIRTELDAIVTSGDLPESWEASNMFRATKYAALALKSRAMLYAASIAKYSQVQLNGIVGIPAADADYYWQQSMDASSQIISSGKFDLYGKDSQDKAANFQNMFLEKTLHVEAIFTKAFLAPDKTHNFDFFNAPQSFKIDYGCATNPTLELVEEYDYVDGTSGELRINDAAGNPIKYANPYDLFKDKDPRLLASVMVPFSPWQNGILEIRRGVIAPDGSKITAANLNDTYGTGENQIAITGKDGPLDAGDPTKSGFYIKKFMNPTERVDWYRSDTYWMVFRYAEILLNYAEAAVELNQNTSTALQYINDIRSRAGVKGYDAIDLAKVRKERKLELAFENHRWWDMIRWRIAATEMQNKSFKMLNPYLVWEEGKSPSEMSYIFEIAPSSKNTRTFLPKLYYTIIDPEQINTNPKLVQNPGY